MVCLVTGSSRGLGKAVATAFGRRGDSVAVHYKDEKKGAEETAAQIQSACLFKADIRSAAEVRVLIDDVVKEFGRIDVLVNNAGITYESLMLKTTEDEFNEVIQTNLKGPFNLIKRASRYMMKQKAGHVINISSYAGMKGKAGLSAYSASKAGIIALTKTAAREVARYNIMVNAVLPGYMQTDMGSGANEAAKQDALRESLLTTYSEPESVAQFVCSLAESKGITGQVFNLDSRII